MDARSPVLITRKPLPVHYTRTQVGQQLLPLIYNNQYGHPNDTHFLMQILQAKKKEIEQMGRTAKYLYKLIKSTFCYICGDHPTHDKRVPDWKNTGVRLYFLHNQIIILINPNSNTAAGTSVRLYRHVCLWGMHASERKLGKKPVIESKDRHQTALKNQEEM